MLFIIDTADLDAIRKAVEFLPIDGVTTNPTIIAKENKADFLKLIKDIREIIGDDRMFHIQTTAKNADDIIKEAMLLQEAVGGNFYIKIPISEEGLKATMRLRKMGIGVTVTAIFTHAQAIIATKAGASFVAPYVNRIDNVCGDGNNVVAEIVEQFSHYDFDCKVLAASFKNVEQVHRAALCGCHSVTVAPDVLFSFIKHPLTDIALADFDKDWQSVYGDKKIPELL